MKTDLKIAHLLCTRLCHDLAGPIGAISAGVELMGIGAEMIDDETISLLSGSAGAAFRKLKFLREAFGWSSGSSAKFDDLERTLIGYIYATSGLSGAPTLEWPMQEGLERVAERLGNSGPQIVSNLALLGLECMHSCETLSLTVAFAADALDVVVVNRTTTKRTSKLREDTEAAISSPGGAPMTAQNVQAHLTRSLVMGTGGALAIRDDGGGAVLTAHWP